jgi:hypothetical protein
MAEELAAWIKSHAAGHGRVSRDESWLTLWRTGGVPGAANWTHENADAANTRVSHDTVVKAPLGILWFGGSSNEGTLPRHGHGPQPQVCDGQVIIEGADFLRTLDRRRGPTTVPLTDREGAAMERPDVSRRSDCRSVSLAAIRKQVYGLRTDGAEVVLFAIEGASVSSTARMIIAACVTRPAERTRP